MKLRTSFLSRKQLVAAVAIGALVLVLGFVAFRDAFHAAAFAIGVVGAGLICVGHVRAYDLPSWRAGIPIFYFVMFFVLPLFQQLSGFADLQQRDAAPKAWLLALAGLVVFSAVIAYMETQSLRKPKSWEARWPLNTLTSFPAVTFMAIVGIAATVWSVNFGYYGLQIVEAERRTTTSGIISSLAIFVDLASVIAWVKVWDASLVRRRGAWTILGIALVVAGMYFGLFSNSKAALIKPAGIAMLAYFAVRRRFNGPILAAVILAYTTVVYPFVTTFRIQHGQDSLSGSELFDESVRHFKSLDWVYGNAVPAADAGDTEAFSSLGRSLFTTYADIIDTVDRRGGVHGQTIVAALAFVVPRVLWPDKPEETVGNFVGHFIEILQPGDNITNVSPTQMGEFYMNFGIIGLIAGMAMWGWIAQVTDRIVCRDSMSWLTIYLFTQIPLQESTLGQGLLSLIKALPLLFALAILVSLVAAAFGRSSGRNFQVR